MGPKYEHFKFEIGDIVQLKLCPAGSQFHHSMMILERLYQECPGGVQLHYRCRHSATNEMSNYLEIEVEKFSFALSDAEWSMVRDEISKRKSERAMRQAFDVANKEPEPPVE